MGGGSLMTPILIFFFNFNPASAIGTDILHGAIFKSFVRFSIGAWGRSEPGSPSGCSRERPGVPRWCGWRRT